MRKLLSRSLRAPFVATAWWRFVTRLHRQFGAPPPTKHILIKPVQAYFFPRLGPGQRLRLLKGHYRFLASRFSRELIARFFDRRGFEAATLLGRKNSTFTIELTPSTITGTEREGEIVFTLRSRGSDLLLSRLSFLFIEDERGSALAIGGLQGPSPGNKRAVIEATRLLYGLRPKDATLLAARAFADALGAQTRAFPDAALMFHRKQNAEKFSDCDAYWLERGARLTRDGEFVFDRLSSNDARNAGRAAIKRAIVEGVRAFVADNLGTPARRRAPPKVA